MKKIYKTIGEVASELNLIDKKKRYAVFIQKKFDYKLNLLNETEGDWYG